MIVRNVRRKEKNLYTENGPGEPVRLITYSTQREEAEDIAAQIAGQIRHGRRRAGDFAVFYRTNALSRRWNSPCATRPSPTRWSTAWNFYSARRSRTFLAYLRLLNNPQDETALLRVINTPPRGIGKTTIDRLAGHATRHGLPLLGAARQVGRITAINARAPSRLPPSWRLSTAWRQWPRARSRSCSATCSAKPPTRTSGASANPEDEERLANIEELLTVAREFDERREGTGHLEAFLEETALVNDTDDWETALDRVTLMTLHASKGLEFPVVYIVAVEEGLLPHQRSQSAPDQVEEERRLFFVGITRAQQELQISMAQYRDFRGLRKLTVPSSFLMELPLGEMAVETRRAASLCRPQGDSSRWRSRFMRSRCSAPSGRRRRLGPCRRWGCRRRRSWPTAAGLRRRHRPTSSSTACWYCTRSTAWGGSWP